MREVTEAQDEWEKFESQMSKEEDDADVAKKFEKEDNEAVVSTGMEKQLIMEQPFLGNDQEAQKDPTIKIACNNNGERSEQICAIFEKEHRKAKSVIGEAVTDMDKREKT
ncbi:hypothetical protein A2U01_0055467 [Trifolium medium]|uniref:Uncharacterized protein n=1 Tax=Trifolium medium TaxID=97028 RepID=A0A392RDC4_9FABA|nr:hypothetical protein [Trifolium medium]